MNDDATVYVVITFHDPNTFGELIEDMEVLDESPLWFLTPLNQVCRVANVNGGDSAPYDNTLDLIAQALRDGTTIDEWVDAHGHKVTDEYVPPPANGKHART